MKREIHFVCYAILILSIWTDIMGCIDFGPTAPRVFTTVFGDSIELFGRGLYRNDATFTATIFRGTDLASLIFCVPAFMLILRYDPSEEKRIQQSPPSLDAGSSTILLSQQSPR